MCALHLDQKFVGTFDNHELALAALIERSENFQRVAVIPSGGDSVEIYCCFVRGVFNYAYASITITTGK